jgi:hypothetical protein
MCLTADIMMLQSLHNIAYKTNIFLIANMTVSRKGRDLNTGQYYFHPVRVYLRFANAELG